jgi:hypothetical protein
MVCAFSPEYAWSVSVQRKSIGDRSDESEAAGDQKCRIAETTESKGTRDAAAEKAGDDKNAKAQRQPIHREPTDAWPREMPSSVNIPERRVVRMTPPL